MSEIMTFAACVNFDCSLAIEKADTATDQALGFVAGTQIHATLPYARSLDPTWLTIWSHIETFPSDVSLGCLKEKT